MENSSFDNFDLQLNEAGRYFLRITAKWASFLSILGFIFLGLMLLMSLFFFSAGSAMDSFGGSSPFASLGSGVLGVIYLLMVVLYFFPVYYLFQFSNKMRRAFIENDSNVLNDALGSLKSHYKFVGILTIIVLSFYILAILSALVFGMSGAM